MLKKMAPRRDVKITSPKKIVQAVPKRTRGQSKSIQALEVPSITTISISNDKSLLDVADTCKKVDVKTKIALADEVARSQLLQEPVEVRSEPPKPKRGRKPKGSMPPNGIKTDDKIVISKFFSPDDIIKKEPDNNIKVTDVPAVEKITKKPAVKKPAIERVHNNIKLTDVPAVEKITKKTAVKKPAIERVFTRKRVADSTAGKPKIKRQKFNSKLNPDKADNPPKATQNNTTEQEIASQMDTPQQKLSPVVNSKQKKVPSKDDAVLKSTVNSIPDVNRKLTSPPIVSTSNLRKRLNRGKQASLITPEKALKPTPECLKSPVPLTPCNETTKPEVPDIKSPKQQLLTNKLPKKPNTTKVLGAPRARPSKAQNRLVKSSKKKIDNVKAKPVFSVANRQNSISSISNLSWTRDISNSSTTTCITVSSNDLVCIDNKLPCIKLNYIDSEVDKYKPKPAVNDEDSSSDDSSSSDSETSSDEQLSDTLHSPSVCTSPVQINSLNLSYSSRNSAEGQIKDQHLNKQDYEKSAEKLMHALKDIDMEFINWVHDTECITLDLNSIKDNLLTILNNEFSTLKHCRNLHEISKLDKMEHSKNIITKEFEVATEKCIDGYQNNKIENKLVTTTVKSNANETSKIDHNQVEPKTIERKIVNSNSAETTQTTSNDINSNATECISALSKPYQSSQHIRSVDKRSPPKNNTNESNIINSKPTVEADPTTVKNKLEEVFIKPSTSGAVINNSKPRSRRVSESSGSSSGSHKYTAKYDPNMFNQNGHDDDDALSLFAESITLIESSKVNTPIVSAPVAKKFEEYVPKPIQKKLISPPNYSYCPTKISDYVKNGIVKTVCEKQNADSTSIYKESSLQSVCTESHDQADSVENHQEIIEQPTTIEINTSVNSNKPRLIGDMYRLNHKESSALFRGYCYFNLINKCVSVLYGKPCRFSHAIPEEKTLISKLVRLSTEFVIKEYMLIRRNMHLMRKYGMCLMFECERRGLTRVVVEIAYDFLTKREKGVHLDEHLQIAAVEVALLHLNTVELSVCEDLLKLEVPNGPLLCDVFMRTMTITQNFSRFKSVFLSLTYFIVNNDRTFSLEVAEHLLERVCILPFDESVVKALIQILRLTSPEIFLNPSIAHFVTLIRQNGEVFDEYMNLKSEVDFEKLARRAVEKHQALQVVDQVVDQPAMQQPIDQPLVLQPGPQPQLLLQTGDKSNVWPEMRDGVPLPPSPDTTHLDNMNKTATEDTVVPKITRTIQGYTWTPNPTKATIKPNRPTGFPNHWRHRSIFRKFGRDNFSTPRQMRPPGQMLRPPNQMMRPPSQMIRKPFDQRLVTFGGSPITYQHPGPDI